MKRRRSSLVLALAGLLMVWVPSPFAAEGDAAAQLHAIFEEEWEYFLRENPDSTSRRGDRRWNDRWPDVSLAAIERRHQHRLEVLERLEAIDYEALSEADKLNYTLFRKDYELEVEAHQYRWYLLPLSHMGGIQTRNELADSLRFATVKDYEDWLARLRGFPTLMDQTIALMREGIRVGMVHPKVIMERVPDQITAQIVDDPAESLFFKPFKRFPVDIPLTEQERLVAEAKTAVGEHIIPSFRRFQEFFINEYLPACYDRVGAWQLPRGRELYAFRARGYTTTHLTPEEIHQIGLREVRRIRGEMEKIIEEVEFEGSFQEFFEFLRTDPQFYYDDPEELLEAYRAIAKQIDPTLVRLFGRLPRMPYGVEPVPEHSAPHAGFASYRRPAADGSRAGTYFVNLYKPEVHPTYGLEAVSFHEAVPGHHLQIALAMELENLPKFRRFGWSVAFGEGWALYAETLGEELGFYQDPYSKFGQLSEELWRAVRLVVDTGMHYLGWTRQQAIDYSKANPARSEYVIVNQIDRYISWPGQALAYKIGELKIKELRARAEQELGERFDIRAFHDTVLGSGAVPLDVLEVIVEDWIERVKRGVVS